MISKSITGAILALSTLGTVAVVSPAQAFTVNQTGINDQQFNQLILDGTFSELFVAESRAGFQGSERELGINAPLVPNANGTGLVGGATLDAGQFNWVSGEVVSFELSYDALNDLVTYKVGDAAALTASVEDKTANGFFIRTGAGGKNGTTSSSFTFQNLMLDVNDSNGFQALAPLSSTLNPDGSRDVDYLEVADLTGSFTLKGEQILEWSGTFPDRSNLASQIKVGHFTETASVPEPMTMLGTVVALGAGYSLKRRRQDQQA